MLKKKFIFKKTVYLSDTNAEGNVYFSRYFEWQGQAREEFYKQIDPNFLTSGVKLITVEAKTKYLHEAVLFDELEIEITINKIRQSSIEMLFIYRNKKTGKIIATGSQVIAYASQKDNKLRPIPDEIKQKLEEFLEEGEELSTKRNRE